jgi:dipeptidase E
MKLLLTSAGLTNKEISNALLELVGKPFNEVGFGYVPTAANAEEGDKSWLIDNLVQFTDQKFKSIDIIEIADLTKAKLLERLKSCDVICFGGGNEKHLAQVLKETGLDEELRQLLEDRVYMGISAGSMVTGKFMSLEINKIVYPDEVMDGELPNTLQYVDFTYIPHLNSGHFPEVRKEVLETLDVEGRLWSTDDHTALKIIDGNLTIIGEGESFTSL